MSMHTVEAKILSTAKLTFIRISKRIKYPHTNNLDTLAGYFTAEQPLMRKEGTQWANDALNMLPEGEQRFVRSNIFEDLSHKEAGEKFGCDNHTAGSMVAKGINRLRKILNIRPKKKRKKKNFLKRVEIREDQ